MIPSLSDDTTAEQQENQEHTCIHKTKCPPMKQEYVGCRAPWYIYWHWCQLLKPKVKLLKLLGSLEASQIQSYLLPPWLEAFKCLNRCHWQCTGWFIVMITGQDITLRTHSQTGTVCLLKLTWYDNLWIDLLSLRPFSPTPIIRVSGICVAWQCALGYCVVSLSVSSVRAGRVTRSHRQRRVRRQHTPALRSHE